MALEMDTAVETTETAAQPATEVTLEVSEAQESDELKEFRPPVITVQNGRMDVCLFKLTRREKVTAEQESVETAFIEQEPVETAFIEEEPIEMAEREEAVERTAFEETI